LPDDGLSVEEHHPSIREAFVAGKLASQQTLRFAGIRKGSNADRSAELADAKAHERRAPREPVHKLLTDPSAGSGVEPLGSSEIAVQWPVGERRNSNEHCLLGAVALAPLMNGRRGVGRKLEALLVLEVPCGGEQAEHAELLCIVLVNVELPNQPLHTPTGKSPVKENKAVKVVNATTGHSHRQLVALLGVLGVIHEEVVLGLCV